MNAPMKLTELVAKKMWIILRFTLLLGLSFVILYPLIYMISVSIRDPGDMYDPSIVWIPRNLTLENFADSIRCMDYGNAFLSSLLIGGVSSVFQIISCSLTAYGFARFKFKGRGFMFAMVILTILVPTQVIILPMYLMFQNLSIPFVGEALRVFMDISLPSVNLLDNPLMFYLQAAFGMGIRSGLYIFLLRQFYRGLPLELEEAAEIDGCNPLATFIRIIIPNSGTMLLTVSLFSLVWYWNDYYSTGIFLNENKTLAIALTGLRTELAADSGVVVNIFESTTQMQAGCILFMLPILIIYLIAQKYFTEGIERSGLVG